MPHHHHSPAQAADHKPHHENHDHNRHSAGSSQGSNRRQSARKSLFTEDAKSPGFTLQELVPLEKIQISKKVCKLTGCFGYKRKNRYLVFNEANKPILGIQEHSSCCSRNFCGSGRRFKMSINNGKGQEIIRLKRKMPSLCSCLSSSTEWCSTIEVFAPPGVYMGTVNRSLLRCKPVYYICDTRGERLFRITGRRCTCARCKHQVFKVETVFGVKIEVGRLRKVKAKKCAEKVCPKLDLFEFVFKKQLSTQTKTLFLAALVMIDVDYYEKRWWWTRYCCP